MRFPNLRYGNPTELRHYAQGMPISDLARQLRRSERTVSNWLTEQQRVPFWVPELLRLRNMERAVQLRRMGIAQYSTRLGVVAGAVIEFKTPAQPVSDCHRPIADKPAQQLHHG